MNETTKQIGSVIVTTNDGAGTIKIESAVECEPLGIDNASTSREINKPIFQWIETTEEHYFDMLGVLPPASRGSCLGADGFQMGEAMGHNEHGQPTFLTLKEEIRVMGSKFYESSRPLSFAEFKELFSNANYYYR